VVAVLTGHSQTRQPKQTHEVILMTASQHTRWVAAGWRTARRAMAALRAIHDEQDLMWELSWQASLDGPRLIGSDLPTPHDVSAGSTT
jgi:hypothetical protein